MGNYIIYFNKRRKKRMGDKDIHESYMVKKVQNWFGDREFLRKYKLDMVNKTLKQINPQNFETRIFKINKDSRIQSTIDHYSNLEQFKVIGLFEEKDNFSCTDLFSSDEGHSIIFSQAQTDVQTKRCNMNINDWKALFEDAIKQA